MSIYIREPISDMQWPALNGFHVPLSTEWEWLKIIMDWLGLTSWDNWRINLRLPFAGYRSGSNASLYNQGSGGYYWSSSPYGSDYPSNVSYLRLSSSNVNANNNNIRADGFSVRCFKDSFETPTSSWTVVNGTLWNAWIFWNQSEWLISITSDWATGYTIQDKNLWATTVYSEWATLSEANCGKYYQWWNNYWFARTWSVTTSWTKVNAQNYWPWNYYSSSTFITASNSDWSSVQNDNLRWWVSQWSWTKNAEVQNIYIWEYAPPTPTDFEYTWAEQCIDLRKWTYCLEVRWAQWWNNWWKWWYSSWCITLNNKEAVYIYVWQCWYNGTSSAFNWWWRWSCTWRWWWWGWWTDIRIGWNTLYHRRIVAGWWWWKDASWNCYDWWVWWWCTWWSVSRWNSSSAAWCGWTQTAAWWYDNNWATATWSWFWVWWYWNCSDSSNYAITWWGWWRYWWWGGQANSWWWWSWYVYNSSTCSNAPSWYCHCTAYFLTNANTYVWTASFPSPSWWTETWHTWNGYARITPIN